MLNDIIPSNARLLEEYSDLSLWQAPSVILAPDALAPEARALRDLREDQHRDKGVTHLYGRDTSTLPPLGDALVAAGFTDWSDVSATIFQKLITMTNFDPASRNLDDDVFAAFKRKFATSPYWNGLDFSIIHRDSTLKITDWTDAVNSIFDLLSVGFTRELKLNMLSKIKSLVNGLSKNVSQSQKESLAENSSLCIVDGKVYQNILYGSISLEARQGKYRVKTEQTLRVVRGYGVLNYGFCNRHASSIIGYDKISADEWVDSAPDNKEPEHPGPGWPADI